MFSTFELLKMTLIKLALHIYCRPLEPTLGGRNLQNTYQSSRVSYIGARNLAERNDRYQFFHDDQHSTAIYISCTYYMDVKLRVSTKNYRKIEKGVVSGGWKLLT